MNTVISRETTTVTTPEDMDDDDDAMTKGAKLYASTKDNNNESVKDANLTFQWYRSGTAIAGATSSSYTLGDDDITKFKNTANVTYKVVVTGKDGYTGTAKDDIAIIGQPSTANAAKVTEEDISIKRGDKYLTVGDVLNAGDELTLAASFADSLGAMNVVWWYNPDKAQDSAETYTGTSFTVPSDATTSAQVAVSITKKDDESMWDQIDFTRCTTNNTTGVKESKCDGALTTKADTAIAAVATQPTVWNTAAGVTNFATPLDCAKSLDSIAVTYKVGDRTLTAPEVGATMTVSVKPQLAGLEYTWEVGGTKVDSNDKDVDPDNPTIGGETGENANAYTIKSANVNKKIKVTVKATTGGTYSDASIKYETEEVAVSSRTISAIKVLKYDNTKAAEGTSTDTWYVKAGDAEGKSDFLNDKADFVNKKSVSAIDRDRWYIIVAMDSDGNLIDSDVSYNLYNFKSGVEKKVPSSQRFPGSVFAAGDVAHFEVAPNMIGYVGSAVSYNLSSAVSNTGEAEELPEEISLTIAPTAGAAGNVDEEKMIVAEGGAVTFTATVEGVTGSPSIKWFDGTGKQVRVGKTYNPSGLTEAANGAFYAEMTVDGTTYTSDAWEVQKRKATVFTIDSSVQAALAFDDAVTAIDQFDEDFALKDTSLVQPTDIVYTAKTPADGDVATIVGANGGTTGAEKLTFAAKPAGVDGNFANGDEVTFMLGTQTFKATFTGATAFTVTEVTG